MVSTSGLLSTTGLARAGRSWAWIAGFVAFSALDLFLTWRLVGSGTAYEANPIAAVVLSDREKIEGVHQMLSPRDPLDNQKGLRTMDRKVVQLAPRHTAERRAP
jgi:hypothetical protein